MEQFAFVVHPLSPEDLIHKFSYAKYCPPELLEYFMKWLPPLKVSKISGVKSKYNQVEGNFVACPLTSRQILELPQEYVIKKIIKTGKLAEKLGAKILGLGAFTSVVGDAGITIAKNLSIPVTTGNSYTVATAIEGTKLAAKLMEMDLYNANVLILGATGSIGAACACILADEVRALTLAARNVNKLEKLANKIFREHGVAVRVTNQTQSAVKKADIIITVTSAIDSIIMPEDLKTGAIVCDVARPRNVSKLVNEIRDDVLVIEGGVVEIPGDIDFGINFGFPVNTAYACIAETMILALEKRYENFTIGRDLTVKQIKVIGGLAKKHGFKLAGLRSFEKPVTLEKIEAIKAKSKNIKKTIQDVG
ncbi:shikimate dehydrogenase [Anaerosinus sp.]|uniref:shikimate dehydrogenase n=1 Tax=Selenobaculum sp. TaxID=3074374 RepID=UPI0015A7EF80